MPAVASIVLEAKEAQAMESFRVKREAEGYFQPLREFHED